MSVDHHVDPGSEADLAIQRALEAASLRAGDSLDSTTASVIERWEPSAAEAGDLGDAADGD
ncbi:hypothetical protein [Agromyces lapidis]|uniref:Uncharacterized protein n=1 Tax=Agromyces lapidis TaxID=279574 RepID=A0ABV5SNQ3_9MICO|nr:hypothetical protein [Agromyces lapidis]